MRTRKRALEELSGAANVAQKKTRTTDKKDGHGVCSGHPSLWQEPQHPVLEHIFEKLITLEDGRRWLGNAGQVCSFWRSTAQEVLLSDTAVSRPARPPMPEARTWIPPPKPTTTVSTQAAIVIETSAGTGLDEEDTLSKELESPLRGSSHPSRGKAHPQGSLKPALQSPQKGYGGHRQRRAVRYPVPGAPAALVVGGSPGAGPSQQPPAPASMLPQNGSIQSALPIPYLPRYPLAHDSDSESDGSTQGQALALALAGAARGKAGRQDQGVAGVGFRGSGGDETRGVYRRRPGIGRPSRFQPQQQQEQQEQEEFSGEHRDYQGGSNNKTKAEVDSQQQQLGVLAAPKQQQQERQKSRGGVGNVNARYATEDLYPQKAHQQQQQQLSGAGGNRPGLRSRGPTVLGHPQESLRIPPQLQGHETGSDSVIASLEDPRDGRVKVIQKNPRAFAQKKGAVGSQRRSKENHIDEDVSVPSDVVESENDGMEEGEDVEMKDAVPAGGWSDVLFSLWHRLTGSV